MNIRERVGKIKWREEKLPQVLESTAFWIFVIFLVALASFALGRLSAMEQKHQPVKITFPQTHQQQAQKQPEEQVREQNSMAQISQTSAQTLTLTKNSPEIPQAQPAAGAYVGSKNGTKYHLPWCSGAKRIAEKNKIWFATKEDAEKAGYTPAGNCPGM